MIRFEVHGSPVVRMRVEPVVMLGSEGTPYDGSYEVVPKVETQVLPTKQKYLNEDVTVLAVPYYEVDNQKGTTIYIASEV